MAELVAVIASTHHPFYYRASTSTGADRPPFADEWVRKVEAFRETLTRARPDVLVMVGSDHFHQLWLDNMPQFLIGKAPFYDANFYNEEREFGLPRMRLAGQEDLSAYLLREGIDAGFDLAFSNELRVDHSITCPSITLRPQNDLPIVPVYTNIFAPPLPQPKRFVQLGRTIRELVESWPGDRRVAVIGTGHLSLESGVATRHRVHGMPHGSGRISAVPRWMCSPQYATRTSGTSPAAGNGTTCTTRRDSPTTPKRSRTSNTVGAALIGRGPGGARQDRWSGTPALPCWKPGRRGVRKRSGAGGVGSDRRTRTSRTGARGRR
jgi:protocatechuate 4,5-dioxygenase, beta chain